MPENKPADPAKSINRNLCRHRSFLSEYWFLALMIHALINPIENPPQWRMKNVAVFIEMRWLSWNRDDSR
jgi:hypothetical protein